MSRWEPDTRGRLEQAALKLYVERGYERTTVADIGKEAGLTERTFFRYFADKREVLFAGSMQLQELLVAAVAEAPAGAKPIEAVASAFVAAGDLLEQRRDHAEKRQAVIDTHPELRERELLKLASLAAALTAALRERGVPEVAAGLTAEAGVAVFKVAFSRWIKDPDHPSLPELVRESLDDLRGAI